MIKALDQVGDKRMKIYIAGKITGVDNYKPLFNIAEERLIKKGHTVLKPSVMPLGFEHEEYMHVSYSMIDICEAIYFLNNWKDSKGAILEHRYAERNGKKIYYEKG